MSYEHTDVPVERSQGAISKLIFANQGSGVAFISQPPNEGFEAQVVIEGVTYHVRVVAVCRPKMVDGWGYALSEKRKAAEMDAERRRVWRVLYYHLKGVYEASRSGVMEFRELILPYIVTKDGKTVSEHLLPRLEAAVSGDASRLLPQKAGVQ